MGLSEFILKGSQSPRRNLNSLAVYLWQTAHHLLPIDPRISNQIQELAGPSSIYTFNFYYIYIQVSFCPESPLSLPSTWQNFACHSTSCSKFSAESAATPYSKEASSSVISWSTSSPVMALFTLHHNYLCLYSLFWSWENYLMLFFFASNTELSAGNIS